MSCSSREAEHRPHAQQRALRTHRVAAAGRVAAGRVAAGLVAVGLVAAGCGDATTADDRLPEFDAVSREADSGPAREGDDGTPLEAKRSYYAAWGRCLRRTQARLEQSWSRYTLDIDPEKHRQRVRGVQPYLDTLESQLEGCPLGTPRPDEVPEALATQGRAFVLSARGYNSRATEMAAYFNDKVYEEDDWADLARSGPALAKAYGDATEAAAAFAAALDVQRDAADRAWLATLAASTPAEASAAWHVAQTTIAARSTAHCSPEAKPLPAACQEAAAAFASARAQLESYRAKHPAEALGVFWLDVYRTHAETLEAALTELEAPAPPRRRGTPPPADRHAKVTTARAAVLGASDRIVFDFP